MISVNCLIHTKHTSLQTPTRADNHRIQSAMCMKTVIDNTHSWLVTVIKWIEIKRD